MIYNGYEDVMDRLKECTKEKYLQLDEQEREQMVNEVFDIYRSKQIFPINYYDTDGINEEIMKCINKDVSFDGKVLNLKNNQGSSLCKFLFPNLHKVECKGLKNNSMWDRFYDNHKLKRAIKLSLSIKKSVTPSEIRSSLELIGGNVATNFKPMNAKALYEHYVPDNGIIYDFSCGFGGRMLGALSSKNNYTYVGCEPCGETYDGLIKLGNYIEKLTQTNNRFIVFKQGSEEWTTDLKQFENKCDFAFSSPPYFNLEKYSDEDTQCYNKFQDIDKWLYGYVRPTIQNIYKVLKDDGKYAVNIADFNVGRNRVKFVDEWIRISQEEGFKLINEISMGVNVRRGYGHNTDSKREGIFVFEKDVLH